jgi:hypothetical protein
MMNTHKSIFAFILYIIFLIAISFLLYSSISNHNWLHCIGDIGMLSTVLWLLWNSEFIKNKTGETVSLKYSRIFRWLAMVVLIAYVILLLR